MSRRSVAENQLRQGVDNPQDAIWKKIRKLREFTCADLAQGLNKNQDEQISENAITSYVLRLKKAGLLTITETTSKNGCIVTHRFKLIKDAGNITPRLTKAGKPAKQGQKQENLWRSIKMLNWFTAKELADTSSVDDIVVSAQTAQTYLKHLNFAGYLRVREGENRLYRYQLLPSKNTGPYPPKILRSKEVYDPNLQQIMNPKSAE